MILRNKLFHCLLKNNTLISSSHYHDHLLFSSTVEIQNPSPEPHFMVEYLINSCGLSPHKAHRASKQLTTLKSTSTPDSVLAFLKQNGFDDAHITDLLSRDPRCLHSDVDKTLKPKFQALKEMGFSELEIAQLVSSNTTALRIIDLRPKIDFWRSLFRTNQQLLKACRRDAFLLSGHLAARTAPNVSLLRERGVPDHQIANIVVSIPRLVGRSPDTLKSMLEWVHELGFSGGSGMFRHALQFVSSNTRAKFDSKVKLLKSLGLSEEDVMSTFKKQPKLFILTEENIRQKMEFFVKEVGFRASFVVLNPVLLSLSLESRLRPRLSILRLLKKGEVLIAKPRDFTISEESFKKKYIISNKEKIQGIQKDYVVACVGNPLHFPSMHVSKDRLQ